MDHPFFRPVPRNATTTPTNASMLAGANGIFLMAKTPARRVWTDEERQTGIEVLAACGGNKRDAARRLKAVGLPVPSSTLAGWRHDRPEQYIEAREKVVPQIKAKLAEVAESAMLRAAGTTEKARAQLDAALEAGEIPVRDLPNAYRNAGTTFGIFADKARDLRGDNDGERLNLHVHTSLEENMATLRKYGLVIEGTAEEIEAAT